ncbi:hypothetical protein D7Y15_39095 [Corallococcus sp. AB030]|uniref:hypothetical protein n=1 Tax=unclassified Corallococcus TaxID=2685029 RepID=UPI000ED85660|nr:MULTISPECIES: hypothetical protein [unclassified Corallococcus]RKH99107.1 hypothetical protein D7Y15_39095 [Corallococcus sp. AB030]RUO87895.1 hypothetical protein D7Y11_38270 [Corallococcus sp. AB018]
MASEHERGAKVKVLRLAVLLALAACSEKSVPPPPGPTATAVVSPPAAEDAGDSAPPVAVLPPAAFQAHPAQVYTGPLATPDLTGGDAGVKMYRTRLRQAAAKGVKFGGRYAVMISGCGTECIFGFAIDAKTGHVMPLPASGEDYRQLQLAFRPDSQWMRAIWMGSSESGTEACVLRDFVLDKGTFRPVKDEVLPGACPELGVGTGEAMGPR